MDNNNTERCCNCFFLDRGDNKDESVFRCKGKTGNTVVRLNDDACVNFIGAWNGDDIEFKNINNNSKSDIETAMFRACVNDVLTVKGCKYIVRSFADKYDAKDCCDFYDKCFDQEECAMCSANMRMDNNDVYLELLKTK